LRIPFVHFAVADGRFVSCCDLQVLVRHCLEALLNIARYKHTTAAVFAQTGERKSRLCSCSILLLRVAARLLLVAHMLWCADCVDILAEIMQVYRDKEVLETAFRVRCLNASVVFWRTRASS
jgi:hypothetical protein